MRWCAVAAVTALGACGGGTSSDGTLEQTRERVGDTLVVRTLSGSAWGEDAHLEAEVSIGELEGDLEYLMGSIRALAVAADGTIYVLDGQGPELRAYGPDGRFLRTLGRPGGGPGELGRPDGGLAILSDGRIVVRDPGNARLQVYAPSGEPVATWPHRGTFFTSTPLFRDEGDHVYVQVLIDPEADLANWEMGLVRIGPDGVPGDTVRIPDADYEAPYVEARSEGGTSRSGVPFSPSESWTLLPDGSFAHGISTRYRITLLRPDAPLTIERVSEPVPVAAAERSDAERNTTDNMRGTDPNWRWNGPSIPDTKPPFRRLFAGRRDRLWVQVSRPGVAVDNPDHDPTDPNSLPRLWREPIAFDVFEADGTYLGQVTTPPDFRAFPTPVFEGDSVWTVTRDDLDVQRVVRFRVVRASETTP